MAILGASELAAIHAAAMAANLGWKRTELLAGALPAFAQSLMTMPSPSAQILSDLFQLNQAQRLQDGSVPIAAWLSKAEQLAGAGAPAETFRAMRARVRGWEEQHPFRG